jgi:ABC-2 type transport system permease protein
MAVYDRAFDQFQGQITPQWSRFLIIPRYAFRDVFGSKLFIAFYALCFAYPLIAAILIYLHHNTGAIALLRLNVAELLPINATFFETYVVVQGVFAFFLNLLVGPPLVSRDLRNNALPLYLSRPFSRVDYIAGKMSVVIILTSAITWIPGLLLYVFQASLEGAGWFAGNLRIASAIFIGSIVWIIVLALLSQAISAWVKWRIAASAALIALFFIPQIIASAVNNLFYTTWGNLFSVFEVMRIIWSSLFGSYVRHFGRVNAFENGRRVSVELVDVPVWTAWVALLILCSACIWLLARKVRAYEVVR